MTSQSKQSSLLAFFPKRTELPVTRHKDMVQEDGDSTTSESAPDEEASSQDDDLPRKSKYELLRERNIERNNARLKSLGLWKETDIAAGGTQPKKGTVKRNKAAVKRVRTVSYPTRRSTRKKTTGWREEDNSEGGGSTTQDAVSGVTPDRLVEDEQFTVSALFEYNMSDTFSSFEEDTTTPRYASGNTLVPIGPRLIPPSGLNAIYSLQFYPNTWSEDTHGEDHSTPSWLVGAGKAGMVALWDCRTPNKENNRQEMDPILSWKAHAGRWIADARFIPSNSLLLSGQEPPTAHPVPKRLLTAANDGTICHWDLTSNSVQTGAPKLLNQTDQSLHASGIFSMDTTCIQDNQVLIATGSKDKTIALSNVERFGTAVWRSDFHSAKVGCVSLSGNALIVSASDDGFVAVHDTRIGGCLGPSSTIVKIEDAHSKPHSAVWQPGSDSVFLTAGLDDTIKLWDSRKVSCALASFHGHVPPTGRNIKRIHRPAFLSLSGAQGATDESFILSGGEGSRSLSMFQLNNLPGDGSLQSVLNRGKLPDEHGDIGSLAVWKDTVAVADDGGEILILSRTQA